MDGRRDIESRLRQSWSVADWWWPLEGHENSEHRKLIGRFAFIVFCVGPTGKGKPAKGGMN